MINPFKDTYDFIKSNVVNLPQSVAMAGSTLKKFYGGAGFGWGWSVVKPLIFILIYWFTMNIGIRGNKPITTDGGAQVPYIVWMVPGVICWFVFSDVLGQGVVCIRKNSHLVNKTVFPLATIPVFNVMSYFVTHMFLIAIGVVIHYVNGYSLDLHFLQIFWYVPLFFLFSCVVTTFVSTLAVISRDFEQFVKAIMNIFFWLTPILWQTTKIEEQSKIVVLIFKLNPFYYFVSGYRSMFLGEGWFWDRPYYLLFIVVFTLVAALITNSLFKKLSPEFADVL